MERTLVGPIFHDGMWPVWYVPPGHCSIRRYFIKSQYETPKLPAAFNAQGSRVITVVVQVGAVKIYVAEVEALRKKKKKGGRQDKTQFTTEIGWKN
jgi:hypothetical protein